MGASKIKGIATELKALSYSVAVLADSDAPEQFSPADAAELSRNGVLVVEWADALCIERRMFADLPWAGVMASFQAARQIKGDDEALLNAVATQYGAGFNRNPAAWADTPELRTALGKAAKVGDWFKRQDRGAEWAAALSPHLDNAAIAGSDLIQKLALLRGWIDNV